MGLPMRSRQCRLRGRAATRGRSATLVLDEVAAAAHRAVPLAQRRVAVTAALPMDRAATPLAPRRVGRATAPTVGHPWRPSPRPAEAPEIPAVQAVQARATPGAQVVQDRMRE